MDYKEKLKQLVIKNHGEESQYIQKKVCFFSFQAFADCDNAAQALRSGWIVCTDISQCEEGDALRIKDYMQGVAYSSYAHIKEICHECTIYFPNEYHIQEFVN